MAPETDGRRTRYEHRRGEILAAVTEHVLDHGVADLTLRSVAAAVGLSHATLVHHFAGRDALVTAIVDEVLTRSLAASAEEIASGLSLDDAWAYLRSPQGQRHARLFESLVGLSLYSDPPFAAAVRASMRRRVEVLAAGLTLVGCPPDDAVPVATSLLARLRGLALDLMVTGDVERLDAAFAVLRRDADATAASWARPPDGKLPA